MDIIPEPIPSAESRRLSVWIEAAFEPGHHDAWSLGEGVYNRRKMKMENYIPKLLETRPRTASTTTATTILQLTHHLPLSLLISTSFPILPPISFPSPGFIFIFESDMSCVMGVVMPVQGIEDVALDAFICSR